jgi:hypothetical protein
MEVRIGTAVRIVTEVWKARVVRIVRIAIAAGATRIGGIVRKVGRLEINIIRRVEGSSA